MSNNRSKFVMEYARAMRAKRSYEAQARPVPDEVTRVLVAGEAAFGSVPPHVQNQIRQELNRATLLLESELIQQRWQSSQREAERQTAQESATFQKASGGRVTDAETARKILAGEKVIPVNTTKLDARGNKVTTQGTRKATDAEHRSAALLLAAKDWLAKPNDNELDKLREREESKYAPKGPDDRRLDLIRSFGAVEALTPDDTPTSSTASDSGLRESISESWDNNTPTTDTAISQEA
jgi:hypothetical protein